MAGSISLALSQQFDPSGKPYGGGQVFFIQAGTVATPQNAFQDLGLTQPWPNPYTLLADGRVPQVYFADGFIKVRITDVNGVQIFNQDNIPVTGPSSGGGGGGGVDPTTVLQTGWIQPIYGTGVITGFVRANGRTLGNASSGATERANADTSALYSWLWNADPNLAVSGGRGVSSTADYTAGKTIALPDWRGRAIAGLDDMGNSPAGVLTTSTNGFGPAIPTTLGQGGGTESNTLGTANLPPYTPQGTNSAVFTNIFHTDNASAAGGSATITSISGSGGSGNVPLTTPGQTFTGSAQGGASTPFRTLTPIRLLTIYIKL